MFDSIGFPRRIGAWLAALVLLFGMTATPALAGEAPLRFGIFPNLSARAIVLLYQPMREWLEKSLGQPVTIYSAPDFKTFLERTFNHEYDLVIMAPHLARLAQTEGEYQPLFSYSQELHAVLVTGKNSAIHSVEDLRGKIVALPDRLALMPVLGIRVLRSHGLQPDSDFRLLYAGSHSNSALAAQRGEAQAAIVGSVAFAQFPEELRDSLRVLAKSESIPNQFILASPNLGARQTDALRKALSGFAATPEGSRFMENNGFGGLKPATELELRKMEPYARDVQGILKSAK